MFAPAVDSRPPISFAREAASLSLEELLGEARDSYALELDIPMTVSRPPVLHVRDASGQWVSEAAEQGAQIGLSMSAQLHARLGTPGDYGNSFLVARALDDVRGWCQGRHLEPRSGPWADHSADIALGQALWRRIHRFRPLCARLTYYTVVWHVPLDRLARHEDLGRNQAAELLHAALRHAWEQRRGWAHAEDSGVGEVLAQQRRERKEDRRRRDEARVRADAVSAASVDCRYCGRPYDSESVDPCTASPDAVIAALPGALVLCTPSDPVA